MLNEFSTVTFPVRTLENAPRNGWTLGIEKDLLSRTIRKGMKGLLRINGDAEINGRIRATHPAKEILYLSFEGKDAL